MGLAGAVADIDGISPFDAKAPSEAWSEALVGFEIVKYQDDRIEFRETVNRIIEFGVAYHRAAIAGFLSQASVPGFVVADGLVSIPGL